MPAPIPVSPQRRRQAARTRLAERTGSVANRVLNDLGLSREIREFVGGKDRKELTASQAEAAYGELDKLRDTVWDRTNEALGRTS